MTPKQVEEKLAVLLNRIRITHETMGRYRDDNSKRGQREYYKAQRFWFRLCDDVRELLSNNKGEW